VLQTHPDEATLARSIYEAWQGEMMATMPYGYTEDPIETVLRETPAHCHTDMVAYCRRLEETGRGRWIEMIRERHPAMF